MADTTEAMCLVYVTVPTVEMGEAIADRLLADRLVAGANLLSGVRSRFRWQGKIESRTETVLILKTLSSHFARVEKAILELHAYEVPCIVALPVTAAHTPFREWVAESL